MEACALSRSLHTHCSGLRNTVLSVVFGNIPPMACMAISKDRFLLSFGGFGLP